MPNLLISYSIFTGMLLSFLWIVLIVSALPDLLVQQCLRSDSYGSPLTTICGILASLIVLANLGSWLYGSFFWLE